MMTTMGCDPVNRSTLKRENAEHGEDILDAFWQPQAAMGEQSVEAKRHSEASGHVNQDRRSTDGAPRK